MLKKVGLSSSYLSFSCHKLTPVFKALIISNNNLSLRHVLWSVQGIVFLQVPHTGDASADLAYSILRSADQVLAKPCYSALKTRIPEL